MSCSWPSTPAERPLGRDLPSSIKLKCNARVPRTVLSLRRKSVRSPPEIQVRTYFPDDPGCGWFSLHYASNWEAFAALRSHHRSFSPRVWIEQHTMGLSAAVLWDGLRDWCVEYKVWGLAQRHDLRSAEWVFSPSFHDTRLLSLS